MADFDTTRLARDPRFQAIVRRRSRLAWTLFALTMVLYFGLILTATIAPGLLARPIGTGSPTSIGWPVGALAIVVPWLFTLIYVARSNKDGRAMSQLIAESAR